MKDNSDKNSLKFEGEKLFPLLSIVAWLVWILIAVIKNNDWVGWIRDIEFSFIWILLILLIIISFLVLLLFHLSNRKSYIEILNDSINIYKPKNYPFFWKMESINIPINEISNIIVNSVALSMRNFSINNTRSWYNVTIKMKPKDHVIKKIKFYQLSWWEKFISVVKEKNIEVNYRISNSIN